MDYKTTRSEKHQAELGFWQSKFDSEGGKLSNRFYEELYTSLSNIPTSYYSGRRILDIGCGPRGSLEWARSASVRVGLDPLAHDYLTFGTGGHEMNYVCCRGESIPFEDGCFDIVSCLNALDHVDSTALVISEIKRVLTDNGLFLLVVEVGHDATVTEPQKLDWAIVSDFGPELSPISLRRFERDSGGIYQSIERGNPYGLVSSLPGVLVAMFRKFTRT